MTRRNNFFVFAMLLAVLLYGGAAQAVLIEEQLSDPALESRARAISQKLRCVVCQNETIDASGSMVAQDLRKLVRQRLAEGDSDQDVLDYISARYGEFVLLDPPLSPRNLLLWALPFLLLAGGGLWIIFRNKPIKQRK